MKKHFCFCVVLLLLRGIAFALQGWMPDPNLRRAVRDALGLTSDERFTRADILKLHRLDPYQLGVENLTGIIHATNLRWFSFAENDVTVKSMVY